MSRGPQFKTQLRKAILEAAAVAEAVKLAEKRAEAKMHSKKPFMESLREHIGKMIDRIDPLETIAVAGATYVIHTTIINTKPLINQVNSILLNPLAVATFDLNPFAGILATATGAFSVPKPEEIKTPDSLTLWIVSFLIAFILIRYAGDIIKGAFDLAKSLPSLLSMLGFAI